MLRPDLFGQTATHYDEHNDQAPIIDFLTRNNFNIHAVDKNGSTVLHQAARWDDVISMKNLLELGAEQNLLVSDKQGRTPLQLALERRCLDVIYFLINQFPHLWTTIIPPFRHGVHLLHAAINHDSIAFFDKVLELGISHLDARDQYGRTPFQLAFRCKQIDLVAHLLARYPHVRKHVASVALAAVTLGDTHAKDIAMRRLEDESVALRPPTISESLAVNWMHRVLESLGAYMLLWLVIQFWTSVRIVF